MLEPIDHNDALHNLLAVSGSEIECKTERRTYTFRSDEEVSEILRSVRASVQLNQPMHTGDESSVSSDESIEPSVDTFDVDKWVREFYFRDPTYPSERCHQSTGPLCIIPSAKRRRIASSPQHTDTDECKSGSESARPREVLPAEVQEIQHYPAPRSRPIPAPSSSAGRSSSSYKSIMKDLHPKGKSKPKTNGVRLPASSANNLNGVKSNSKADEVSNSTASAGSSSKPPTLGQYKLIIDNMRLENSSDDSFMTPDDAVLWSEIATYIVAYKPIVWTELAASLGRGVKYCRDRWFDVLNPAISYRRKRFKELEEGQSARARPVQSAPQDEAQVQQVAVVRPVPQRAQLPLRQQSIPHHNLLPLVPQEPVRDSPQVPQPDPPRQEQPPRQQVIVDHDATSVAGVAHTTSTAVPAASNIRAPTRTPRMIDVIIAANPTSLEQTNKDFASLEYGDRSAPGAFSTLEDATMVLTLLTTNDAALWWPALDARFNRPVGSCKRRWQEVTSIVNRQRGLRGQPVQQRAVPAAAIARDCHTHGIVQPLPLPPPPPHIGAPPLQYEAAFVAATDRMSTVAPAPASAGPSMPGGVHQLRAADMVAGEESISSAVANGVIPSEIALSTGVHRPAPAHSTADGVVPSSGPSNQPPSRLKLYNQLRAVEGDRALAVNQCTGQNTAPVVTNRPLPPSAEPLNTTPRNAVHLHNAADKYHTNYQLCPPLRQNLPSGIADLYAPWEPILHPQASDASALRSSGVDQSATMRAPAAHAVAPPYWVNPLPSFATSGPWQSGGFQQVQQCSNGASSALPPCPALPTAVPPGQSFLEARLVRAQQRLEEQRLEQQRAAHRIFAVLPPPPQLNLSPHHQPPQQQNSDGGTHSTEHGNASSSADQPSVAVHECGNTLSGVLSAGPLLGSQTNKEANNPLGLQLTPTFVGNQPVFSVRPIEHHQRGAMQEHSSILSGVVSAEPLLGGRQNQQAGNSVAFELTPTFVEHRPTTENLPTIISLPHNRITNK